MRQPLIYELELEHALPSLTGVTHLNLAGDYRYLLSGYYDSLDAELDGLAVIPTPQDALDAYVVPIAMEKAKKGGLAVPDYDIVVDKLTPPPIMAYPVNPFMEKGVLIASADKLDKERKALSMTGKYAVICQKLEADYRIDVARIIMGECLTREYQSFAQDVFQVFRLPLMRARIIVTARAYQLSAIEPLPYFQLTLNEKKLLEERGL